METVMHWVETADGHRLYVQEAFSRKNAPIIVFLHGLFSDGRFFLNGRGKGPAAYFVEQGYRVFIADLRGHGRSQQPEQGPHWNWCFDHYVEHDIPALVKFVQQQCGHSFSILAHSLGGYVVLASLGQQPELQSSVDKCCVLACAVNDFTESALKKRLSLYGGMWIAKLYGHFPARRLKMGSSDESYPLMRQFVQWAEGQRFESQDGRFDYWKALGQVEIPVLSIIGESDLFHASPTRAKKLVEHLGSKQKELKICGPATGHGKSYGHVDIIRGEQAQREILPSIHRWLADTERETIAATSS